MYFFVRKVFHVPYMQCLTAELKRYPRELGWYQKNFAFRWFQGVSVMVAFFVQITEKLLPSSFHVVSVSSKKSKSGTEEQE